ncbi:hypothetical protein [Sphingobium sp. CFD-1]|uniref:hypothetical protein n=1 Tax=Sphingobium sp. CFD-1 TaxID=2878545 RepID=UPI00214BDC59|nr:hypothetical protein [Sphingobium sp. CFD-1]
MATQIIPITNKKVKDRTGERWGRLTVLGYVGTLTVSNRSNAGFLCRCDCGEEKVVAGTHLQSGLVASCGCLHRDVSGGKPKHGAWSHPLYGRWNQMQQRCFNPSHQDYHDYGGRGITVCDRWRGDHGVLNFIADMGDCPDGMTLDRRDVDGNYEPGNCRWATVVEQNRNRRSNRHILYNGTRMTIAEAAERSGVDSRAIWRGLRRGKIVLGPEVFEEIRSEGH